MIASPALQNCTYSKEVEFFVFASNSLWEVLTVDEVCTEVHKHLENGGRLLSQICQRLCDEAVKRGTEDNISIILVENPYDRDTELVTRALLDDAPFIW